MFSEQQEEKGNQTYQSWEYRNSGAKGPSPVVYSEEEGTHQVSVLPSHFKELGNTRTKSKISRREEKGQTKQDRVKEKPFNMYERSNEIKSVC